MPNVARPIWGLLFVVVAVSTGCARPSPAPPAAVAPGVGTELRVLSTADWGCIVPPFRHESCGTEEAPGENPGDCFVLTRTVEGPWDPSVFGGAVHVLSGHYTGETMTLPDWYVSQGRPAPHAACHETEYSVFEFDGWCTEATVSELDARYGIADADAEYTRWVDETRARIEAHSCRASAR